MEQPPPIPPRPQSGDEVVSTIIPYKNTAALFAYYCAVFSLIPCLGGVLGLVALILGIIGLKAAALKPEAKGKVHAWIGVILGGLIFLAHLVVVVGIVVKAASER